MNRFYQVYNRSLDKRATDVVETAQKQMNVYTIGTCVYHSCNKCLLGGHQRQGELKKNNSRVSLKGGNLYQLS